jgi:putative PIN family toxin of toxin-antitoxin system
VIRIVVDTNVYISALVFGGKPAFVLQAAEARGIQLVASRGIESELVETLTDKFGWSIQQIQWACERLWREAYWSAPAEPPPVVARDADDYHVLAASLESGARFIVTGDRDLLALESINGISILTPAAFLEHLQGEIR